jgi:hypothetical protein
MLLRAALPATYLDDSVANFAEYAPFINGLATSKSKTESVAKSAKIVPIVHVLN